MPPVLVARAAARHRSAGWWVPPLVGLGWIAIAAMLLIGPLWALVFGALLALGPVSAARLRRTRWEVDAPGDGARFRWGVDAARSAALADIGGIIEQVAPGASSRGIPVTRDSELWHLVGHDGAWLGTAATSGLDPAEVERARALVPGERIPYGLARRIGAIPAGAPWQVRHPGRAVWLAGLVSLAVMALLITTTAQLSWVALLAG